MIPTRASQPYRREPGPALDAMQGGKPFFLPNPMDTQRRLQRQGRGSALRQAVDAALEQRVPRELMLPGH